MPQVEQRLPLGAESPIGGNPEAQDKQLTTSFERASQEIERASQECQPGEDARPADQEGVFADESRVKPTAQDDGAFCSCKKTFHCYASDEKAQGDRFASKLSLALLDPKTICASLNSPVKSAGKDCTLKR